MDKNITRKTENKQRDRDRERERKRERERERESPILLKVLLFNEKAETRVSQLENNFMLFVVRFRR